MSAINLHQLIKALDAESKNALERAAETCVQRGGSEILIEDVLINFLDTPESFLNAALKQFSIDKDTLLAVIKPRTSYGSSESSHPVLSTLIIQWLQESYLLATLDMHLREVLAGCMILALLKNSERYGHTRYYQVLAGIPPDKLQQQITGLIESAEQSGKVQQQGDNALKQFTKNLTQQARENKIDPVLCRDDEIRKMVDILARRRKNNPIAVGEAGVGKTAVVEGLALKIAHNDVPDTLKQVELLTLDMGLLQAGASVKGEFERRLKAVIDEVKASPKPIILFIDEAHTLIGAGGQAGGGDAANLLKPALARGELRTIAATTWSEYKKYFEKDPALARRFQPVQLLEPTVPQAVTILRGLASHYEADHGVYLRDDAVMASAELSARFISGRQLPDKSVDVLDTACARVKISMYSTPAALDNLKRDVAQKKRELTALERDADAGIEQDTQHITALHADLETLKAAQESTENAWQVQKALVEKLLTLRQSLQTPDTLSTTDEVNDLQQQLNETKAALATAQAEEVLVHYEVSPRLVAEVISGWTGIPLTTLLEEHSLQVLTFADNMHQRIKGQDQALDCINRAIRLHSAGLSEPETPTGVFLLAGPSGVGKTETALAIADLLYGGERFLTTINMSEYQEKHSLSRLIGSPPGYVGYGEGGVLTEAVRQKPYSVILLDEVEKADPDIMNLFYQIFDKGVANDGEGRLIDFRNTLILMTSNLGDQLIINTCKGDTLPDAQHLTEIIRPALKCYFKPALLGRMTVVPYYPIQPDAMQELVRIRLDRLAARLNDKHITFSYSDLLVDTITKRCLDTESGARYIKQLIDTHMMPAISDALLNAIASETILKALSVDINDEGELTMDLVSSTEV